VRETEHAKKEFEGDHEIRIKEGLERLEKKYAGKAVEQGIQGK